MGKAVGIGTVYLMVAQLITIACGYVINILLGRWLGPEQYGVFGVVMSLYLINRAFTNTGVPTVMSRLISEAKNNLKEIIKASYKIQFTTAIIFGLAYILLSKQIASFLKDDTLVSYIVFLGIMMVPLALVPLSNGYLRGLRAFKKQSLFRSAYPLSKLAFTVVLVLLGLEIFGALLGHFLSLIFTLIIGWLLLRKITVVRDHTPDSASKLVNKIIISSIPIVIASLALAQLRNISTLLLKYFSVDNWTIGIFTAALTVSNAPYLIFGAVPQALLPAISKAVSENNPQLTQKYIVESFRYQLLLLLPMTVITYVTSEKLVTLLYSKAYASAGPMLGILMISSSLLAVFTTFLSVMEGSGNSWFYTIINLVLVIILSALSYIWIPQAGAVGAALASVVASSIAVIFMTTYIFIKFKITLPYLSLLRIGMCSAVIFFLAQWWSWSGIYLLASYAIYFLFYFLLLYLFGEITEDDLQYLKRIIPFRNRKS